MAEEKKQEVKEESPQVKTEAVVQKEEKKAGKVEIAKNCAECNKPVKKIRYYRNMKFFCNKKCWNSFKKKTAAKNKTEAEKPEEKVAK